MRRVSFLTFLFYFCRQFGIYSLEINDPFDAVCASHTQREMASKCKTFGFLQFRSFVFVCVK